MYAPVTGWYTFGNETGIERTQNSFLSGEDDRLFVNRLVDLVNGNATKGGNVAAHDQPRGAAGGVRRAARRSEPTCRAPSWRSSRTPGRSWRWCRCRPSTRTSWPTTTSRRPSAYATQLSKLKSPAAAQPGDPDHAAAGLDVQAGHRGRGASRPASTTPTRWCPAGPTYTLPPVAQRGAQRRSSRLQRRQDPVDPGAWSVSCNTAFAPLAVERRRERRCTRPGRGVRVQPAATSTTCPGRRRRATPRRSTRRDGAVRLRPGLGHGHRRCRWRWSPPGSPTTAW